jgi:hypothetical protein
MVKSKALEFVRNWCPDYEEKNDEYEQSKEHGLNLLFPRSIGDSATEIWNKMFSDAIAAFAEAQREYCAEAYFAALPDDEYTDIINAEMPQI